MASRRNSDKPAQIDTTVPTDDIQSEPKGVEDVKAMNTTLGAAASGVLLEEDVEQARLRVRDAQVILAELGYLEDEHGGVTIDGSWGPATRDAIVAFQSDHGLERGGQLDAETYERLLAEHEWMLEMQASSEAGEDEFEPLQPDKPLRS